MLKEIAKKYFIIRRWRKKGNVSEKNDITEISDDITKIFDENNELLNSQVTRLSECFVDLERRVNK